MADIIGIDGKPIKKRQIPVIKVGDFTLPLRIISEKDLARVEGGQISPVAVLEEIRAVREQMQDMNSIFLTLFSIYSKENPESNLAKVFTSMGFNMTDIEGKDIMGHTVETTEKSS